jgi:hypothetical protein
MAGTSPTRRTLEWFRKQGIQAGIVERYITAGANRAFGNRVDLFNLFDIITCGPIGDGLMSGIAGVQCFTTAWREHEEKFLENEEMVRCWLSSGGSAHLWGWRKLKVKRGGKAVRWTPRVKIVTIENDLITFNDLEIE